MVRVRVRVRGRVRVRVRVRGRVRVRVRVSSALNLARCTFDTSRIVPGRWLTRYGLS